jgi:hypothetical protein
MSRTGIHEKRGEKNCDRADFSVPRRGAEQGRTAHAREGDWGMEPVMPFGRGRISSRLLL